MSDAQEPRGTGSKRDFMRGEFFPSELAPFITATVHPSSILRAPDAAARERESTEFVHDLEHVAAQLVEMGWAQPIQGAGSCQPPQQRGLTLVEG